MSDRSQTWKDYTPSKTVWFWSCAASIVLTMIVGFTWGGWVTGGTARENAENAAENATAKLAASICAYRFLRGPDASAQLAALKEASSWERDSLIEDGGWVTFASMDKPVRGAADMCADQLASAELPVADATNAADRKIEIMNN